MTIIGIDHVLMKNLIRKQGWYYKISNYDQPPKNPFPSLF